MVPLGATENSFAREGNDMETVADGAGHEHHYGYINRKDEYLKRLRRIEGQARGLQRMVEDEKYCIDILTQVAAMTKALQAVSLGLLEEHLSHCVVEAARAGGREADEKVREASQAIARLVRS
jgi:CsoR family transcriptional regulator, copper-sensing transcriptional repressor